MFNKVIIAGRLANEPEHRAVKNGKQTEVTTFRIASSTTIRDKKETLFMNVTIFGKQAVSAFQYLQKGDPVIVEGRIRMNQFQTKDGTKVTTYEVIGNRIIFLPKKRNESPRPQVEPPEEVSNDELDPF